MITDHVYEPYQPEVVGGRCKHCSFAQGAHASEVDVSPVEPEGPLAREGEIPSPMSILDSFKGHEANSKTLDIINNVMRSFGYAGEAVLEWGEEGHIKLTWMTNDPKDIPEPPKEPLVEYPTPEPVPVENSLWMGNEPSPEPLVPLFIHPRPDIEEEPTSTALSTYVDKSMFEAEEVEEDALLHPKVYLLSATPDPLGAVAAASMMYEGRVIRSLSEITDDERRHYFDQCFKTTLKAPLEFIDFHFMVEGVTRSHTHQEVRQRTAVFAQESMRFAVKDKIAARPGPIVGANKKLKDEWDKMMSSLWESYNWMIANGVPAEEARGILPHDTLTRLHHKVNLRNLMDEIGKRLCTQAQFEWRGWGSEVRRAIGEYGGDSESYLKAHAWQFAYIANSPMFKPICFTTGKCMFQASMDRGCTIRERVEAGRFGEIETREWAQDPTAAWQR